MKKIILLFNFISFISFAAFPQTFKFKNLADMPTPLGATTSASDDKNLYVLNGFSVKESYSGIVEKYDIDKDKWSILTTRLIPKLFSNSVIIGSNLYVFNGDAIKGKMNTKIEVVNVNTGEITFSADNPEPAHAAGVATWDGNIYVFGGKTISGYSNKLRKFNPSTKEWTTLATMTEEKEVKGVFVDGKLYVVGGYSGKISNKIDMYDTKTDTWTTLDTLPFGISANSVAASGSKIYTLFDFSKQTFIGCYDISSKKFTILKQKNMIGRRHAGAHILNNKLYIMGGNTSTTMSSCLSSLQVADLKQ